MAPRGITGPVFRLVVDAWPPGSRDPATGYPVLDWEPEGWTGDKWGDPEEGFSWPRHDRRYLSSSGAHGRAKLLRSYGATVRVEESAPLVWPEECEACADHHLPGECHGAHPLEALFIPPTTDRWGVCICGAPLVPGSEWCDDGMSWSHLLCSCGRLYVDEETFTAIYDPADVSDEDRACHACQRRLAGWVPLAAPSTPGGSTDGP